MLFIACYLFNKMGFIKNFIDKIQEFVNKLERKVLRIDHSILSTFYEESIDSSKNNPGKNNKVV